MELKLLGKDDSSITVQGPNGPLQIAKGAITPGMLQSFMGADLSASPAAAPGPVPGLDLGQPQASLITTPQPTAPASPELGGGSPVELPAYPGATVQDKRSHFDKGIDEQQAAATQIGQNAYHAGAQQANALAGLQDQANKLDAERKINQFKREDEEKTFREKITKASDEAARNLPGKDFWADRSTESRVGAAIAVGLGAIGSALSGGQNQAVQIIDNAIQTDLKRQQQRYEGLKDQTSQAKDAYGVMLKSYGDKDSALLAMQEAAYKRTQLKIQQYGAIEGSADGQSKAQMLIGQLEEKRGETENKLIAAQKKRDDDMREAFVPALGGHATSKEGAAKVNELAGATATATEGIKKLIEISRRPAKSWSPQDRAEADTIARTTQAALRVPILGPGTVNDREREMIERIVADPTSMTSMDANVMKRLETLRTQLQANLVQNGKAYGLGVPTQVGMAGADRPKIGTPR